MSFRLFTRLLSLVSVCVTLAVALASCSIMIEVGQQTMVTSAPRTPWVAPHHRPVKVRHIHTGRPQHPAWRPLALYYHGVPHGLAF